MQVDTALGYAPGSVKYTDQSSGSAASAARLTRDEFLKILVAEMSNQDPLAPMDNQELLNQMANMQNLEATSSLTDTLKEMHAFQQMGAASALIGKLVKGIDDEGSPVSGVVSKVVAQNGTVRLVVDDKNMSLGNVQEILNQGVA